MRHDSDDGESVTVEFDCAAENAGIAVKQTLPQSIAEDDNFGSVKHIFGRLKIAAENGSDAEHVEEAGAHALAFEPFRLFAAGQCGLPRLKNGH